MLCFQLIFDYESEIIPTNLHPQPPRRAKSLMHLYVPVEDYDCPKEMFFENETAFTSDGSDSLLSASKCQKKLEKNTHEYTNINENVNRVILNTIMDARERNQQEQVKVKRLKSRGS